MREIPLNILISESKGTAISVNEPVLLPGQRYVLQSNTSAQKIGYAHSHRELRIISPKKKYPIQPVDLRQRLAADLVMDPNILMGVILGSSGTGKTFLAINCGINQVLQEAYEKLIIVKAMVTVGNGRFWGTVPGDENEKMAPFTANIWDILERSEAYSAFSNLRENDRIEVVPPDLLRGRDLVKTFIIVDEAQNLTPHELLTVATRVSKDSKIILTGDLNQVDNASRQRSGIEALLDSEIFWQSSITSFMSLKTRMRSPICEVVEDALVPECRRAEVFEVTDTFLEAVI